MVLLTMSPVLAAPTDGLIRALQATLVLNLWWVGKRAEVSAKRFLGDSSRTLSPPTLGGDVNVVDDDIFSSRLTLSQPLSMFGRIGDSIAFADANMVLELSDFWRVKRDLMQKTALAYARVEGVLQKTVITEDKTVALTILYEQVQRREQAQLASTVDVRMTISQGS